MEGSMECLMEGSMEEPLRQRRDLGGELEVLALGELELLPQLGGIVYPERGSIFGRTFRIYLGELFGSILGELSPDLFWANGFRINFGRTFFSDLFFWAKF